MQTVIDLMAEAQPAARVLQVAQIADNTLANEAAAQYNVPTR